MYRKSRNWGMVHQGVPQLPQSARSRPCNSDFILIFISPPHQGLHAAAWRHLRMCITPSFSFHTTLTLWFLKCWAIWMEFQCSSTDILARVSSRSHTTTGGRGVARQNPVWIHQYRSEETIMVMWHWFQEHWYSFSVSWQKNKTGPRVSWPNRTFIWASRFQDGAGFRILPRLTGFESRTICDLWPLERREVCIFQDVHQRAQHSPDQSFPSRQNVHVAHTWRRL